MKASDFRIKEIKYLDGHIMYYPQINIVCKPPPRWKFWAKTHDWRGFTNTMNGLSFSGNDIGSGSGDLEECKKMIREFREDSAKKHKEWVKNFNKTSVGQVSYVEF